MIIYNIIIKCEVKRTIRSSRGGEQGVVVGLRRGRREGVVIGGVARTGHGRHRAAAGEAGDGAASALQLDRRAARGDVQLPVGVAGVHRRWEVVQGRSDCRRRRHGCV